MEKWVIIVSLFGSFFLITLVFGSSFNSFLSSSTSKSVPHRSSPVSSTTDSKLEFLRKGAFYKNFEDDGDDQQLFRAEQEIDKMDETSEDDVKSTLLMAFPSQDTLHYNYLPGYFNMDYRSFNNPEIDVQYCMKGNYQTSYWRPLSVDDEEDNSFMLYDHLQDELKKIKRSSQLDDSTKHLDTSMNTNIINGEVNSPTKYMIPFLSYKELNQTLYTKEGEIFPGGFSFNESGFHFVREHGGNNDSSLLKIKQPIEYTQFTFESGKSFKVAEAKHDLDSEEIMQKETKLPDFYGIPENNCNYRIFNKRQVESALAGRWLHLDGDSLTRDTFYDLIEIFQDEMIIRSKSHDDQVYVKKINFSNDDAENSFMETSLQNQDNSTVSSNSLFKNSKFDDEIYNRKINHSAYRRNKNVIPSDFVVITLGFNPSFKDL